MRVKGSLNDDIINIKVYSCRENNINYDEFNNCQLFSYTEDELARTNTLVNYKLNLEQPMALIKS